MAWVAVDRAIKSGEHFGYPGPLAHWRDFRDMIKRGFCQCGYDSSRKTFTQYYGSEQLDASLLMLAPVGFLPPDDERIVETVAAIERELLVDGFVLRYSPDQSESVDGLPAGEGVFLACTFWLADNYALMGRVDEARRLFDRLLALDQRRGALVGRVRPGREADAGNFPQAFSHVGLVTTALNLSQEVKPAEQRGAA